MSVITQKFSKILIAIDGSEQSLHAANYAISIAQKYSAEPLSQPTLELTQPTIT